MARLLIVSNRLPFTLTKKSGTMEFQESSGGLVTALGSYPDSRKQEKDFETVWIGWPATFIAREDRAGFVAKAKKEFSAHPVWIPVEEMNLFYHGGNGPRVRPAGTAGESRRVGNQ